MKMALMAWYHILVVKCKTCILSKLSWLLLKVHNNFCWSYFIEMCNLLYNSNVISIIVLKKISVVSHLWHLGLVSVPM